MRVHQHLVHSIAEILIEVFCDKAYADKSIEKHLKQNKKWGARDRRFIAESVYEMVRWWRWLHHLNSSSYEDTTRFNKDLMIQLWGVWWVEMKKNSLPDWWSVKPTVEASQNPSRAVRESIPDWLDQLGEKELGGSWGPILSALNEPAYVYLRVNRLKTSPPALIAALANEGIEVRPLNNDLPDTLVLPERKNVFVTQAFRSGHFEVQDAASQFVAPLLQVEPGHRVVDACAGAGGKTLHLSALMENRGKILSMDIHQWKLNELKKRAKRAGAQNIETRHIESTKVIKRLYQSCDRLLLDVPCSGLGVLKRNPDTKWKLTPEDLTRLANLQNELLVGYSKMLKPGGKLVYATCSILPSENEKQIERFVQEQSGWRIEEVKRLNPDQTGFDGFFAARLAFDQ